MVNEKKKRESTSNTTQSATYTPAIPLSIPGISAQVKLHRGKARLFQDGNPIIYSTAISSISSTNGDDTVAAHTISNGQEVVVLDHVGNAIGRGLYNSFSQYKVRILARVHESTVFSLTLRELLVVRVKEAVLLRRALCFGGTTTAFRLINGEGDRLSGLIVDVLGDSVVCRSSAVWCEVHKTLIENVINQIVCEGGGVGGEGKKLIWRRAVSHLAQDGYQHFISDANADTDADDDDDDDDDDDNDSQSSSSSSSIVYENNLKFAVNPRSGQKTGFYCDQRDNKLIIRHLSYGKTVLDMFCYSGGFSMNAIQGGAKYVVAVDSSPKALLLASHNIQLNNMIETSKTEENFQSSHREIDTGTIELIQMDAIEYMKSAITKGDKYDIVICDPPKLAPNRRSLDKSEQAYKKLNTLAMQLVNPGGLLLTCTCSAAMAQDSKRFKYLLSNAGVSAGKDLKILKQQGAAMDHPIHSAYPEGAYLSAVLLHVL